MRGHEPFPVEEFNGYFNRGDTEVVPPDHASNILNLTFGESYIEIREEILPIQSLGAGNNSIVRVHEYTMQTQRSHLILNNQGEIFHRLANGTIFGPILTIATMTDFNVESFAGRAYITPFFTNANNQQIGLQNEFLYVYKGDGSAARIAGGNPPPALPAITPANGAAGHTDPGIHVFAVVFETDTGFLTAPGAFASFTTSAGLSVSFTNVPISGQAFVTKRHILATKAIPATEFNGNLEGFQFFFIPDGTINDNVTTFLNDISFYDLDLLEDASHLFDNFSTIPAGVGLTTYHNRLVLTTTFADISVAYVSHPGEPEAIDQVDGVLIVPLDGKPITNCRELRDVLYLFKNTLTVAYSDNEDVPSTWQPFTVDEGIGTVVHGIGTVLDSGGVNIDYLIVAGFSGVMLFNGNYSEIPLSWKINSYWLGLNTTKIDEVENVVDNIKKVIYFTQPDGTVVLIGDYNNGLNPKDIRWTFISLDMPVTTVDILESDTGFGNVQFLPIFGCSENASQQCGLYITNPNRPTMFDTLRTNAEVSTLTVIPTPTMTSGYALIDEDESIVHCVGIKIRIKGLFIPEGNSSEPVSFTLLSLPGGFSASVSGFSENTPIEQSLQNIDPVNIPTGREPQILANFSQQRFAFRIECVPPIVGARYFRLHRIVLFYRKHATMFPA